MNNEAMRYKKKWVKSPNQCLSQLLLVIHVRLPFSVGVEKYYKAYLNACHSRRTPLDRTELPICAYLPKTLRK